MFRLYRLLLVMLLLAKAQPPSWAQPLNYPPFDAGANSSAEYRQAVEMIPHGEGVQAIALLKDVAARNPHTTLGATCLFRAAYASQDADRRILYAQVSRDYARSRFDIIARACLINLDTATYPRDHQGRLQRYDQMLQSFGAPPLANVLSGATQASRTMRTLPLEIQKGFDQCCIDMGGTLVWLHRPDDALSLAIFQRNNFPFNHGASSRIRYLLAVKRFGDWQGFTAPPDKDPEVHLIQPKQRQTTGPRPRLAWETTVGDWRYAQVDISKVSVLLDGQEIRDQMTVNSKVYGSLSTRPNAVYERLRFSVRPGQPLARGLHRVVITVPVTEYRGMGPGQARINLEFTVGNPKDEREDDDDCDDGDHLDLKNDD